MEPNPPSSVSHAIPSSAAMLGYAGLIPFAGAALAAALLPAQRGEAVFVLLAYGAVILSFLGAVHWGQAIGQAINSGTPGGPNPRTLVWSVTPALLGWVALMIAPAPGLVLEMIGFGLCFAVDRTAVGEGRLPGWYGRLRRPLSAGAVLALGLGLLVTL